eukprot:GHVO01027896.1.p1 GENE.GHVO01027896.1~~GHVO01027896.1.p1  ORF type:complete len:701 (+),score=111.41 GHVO01027896.1:306-2105(+)
MKSIHTETDFLERISNQMPAGSAKFASTWTKMRWTRCLLGELIRALDTQTAANIRKKMTETMTDDDTKNTRTQVAIPSEECISMCAIWKDRCENLENEVKDLKSRVQKYRVKARRPYPVDEQKSVTRMSSEEAADIDMPKRPTCDDSPVMNTEASVVDDPAGMERRSEALQARLRSLETEKTTLTTTIIDMQTQQETLLREMEKSRDEEFEKFINQNEALREQLVEQKLDAQKLALMCRKLQRVSPSPTPPIIHLDIDGLERIRTAQKQINASIQESMKLFAEKSVIFYDTHKRILEYLRDLTLSNKLAEHKIEAPPMIEWGRDKSSNSCSMEQCDLGLIRSILHQVELEADGLRKENKLLKDDNDFFATEVSCVSDAFESKQKEIELMSKQLQAKEESTMQLFKENSILKQLNSNVNKIHTGYAKELADLRTSIQCMSQRSDEYADAISCLREKASASELITATLCADKGVREMELTELHMKTEALESDISAYIEKISGLESEVASGIRSRIKRKREGSKLTESTGADSSALAEENEALKNIMKCALCSENYKDTYISKCGHCFCKECLTRLLTNRNRKCPQCKTSFQQQDMRRLFLN